MHNQESTEKSVTSVQWFLSFSLKFENYGTHNELGKHSQIMGYTYDSIPVTAVHGQLIGDQSEPHTNHDVYNNYDQRLSGSAHARTIT